MGQNRELAVIMFTDIVGYSTLMENDEQSALYLLEMNRQIIQSALKQHQGQWTKEIGDGTLSTFHSTVDALNCAANILNRIQDFSQLNLRIGLHLGDIIREEQDIFGDGVNIAARIQHLAPSNGIAISHHFHAQLHGKTNFHFDSIGFPALKNIHAKVEVLLWHPNRIDSASTEHTAEKPPLTSETKHSLNQYHYLLITIMAFLIALISWQLWPPDQPIITETEKSDIPVNSIAVLKFEHIGRPEENQYLNEGLSEELLNLLARISELKVASRTSSWALPANATTAMVREKLKVNYLVEGSVRKSNNNNLRITVQLIETETGFHLWSETYDRQLSNMITLQDEIAQNITQSLKLLLSAQSLKQLEQEKEIKPQAYEQYLIAKRFLRKPKSTKSLTQAIQSFNTALTIDPTFELASAGLCDSQIEYYQLTRLNSDFSNAEKTCLSILKSNSYQSDIYNSLGLLYLVSGNYLDAKHHFQSALTLNLSSTYALIGLGRTMAQLNDVEAAKHYFIRAIQSSPDNHEAHQHYGSFLFRQGENDAAIMAYKKVIALVPDYGVAYNSLGTAYFANGEFKRGIASFQQSLEISETHEAYSNLGTAFFLEKQFVKAASMYQKAIELAPNNYLYWGFLAESYENTPNKKEQALTAYRQAIKKAELARDINRNNHDVLVSLTLYYAKINDQSSAINILKSIDINTLLPELLYALSISYVALSDSDSAIRALAMAVEKGYDKEMIRMDENFASLVNHPEYIELLSLESNKSN